MGYIFVSYSHFDKEYVHKLQDALKSEGLDVWIDDRIDYGQQWPKVIQEQLDGCDSFIVVMSENSLVSEWVQNEVTRAKRIGKPFFPLLLSGKTWLSSESIQYVDVKDGELPPPKFYQGLKKVITPSEEIQNIKSKADKLYSEGIRLDIEGYAERALQLFRQVKELDPFYPNIDMQIRNLEEEIHRGYVDQNGRVNPERYKQRQRLSLATIATVIGLIILMTSLLSPLAVKYFSPIPTIAPTETIIPTATSTMMPTSTNAPTETTTPTSISTLSPIEQAEIQIPAGFTLYDTFDADLGKWKFTDDSTQCHRKLENGRWQFECFGSATEGVDLTIFPSDSNVKTSQGVAMAFYTLPQLDGTIQWGKYQLMIRFGSACEDFERAYYVSIRPNELAFVEADSKFNSINSPSPTESIGTLQPHIIKIELENGQVAFYLDDTLVRSVVPLENTPPVCWIFESEDNNVKKAEGYRGMAILWIATKP